MRKWLAPHRKVVSLVVLAAAYAAGIVLFVSWGRPLGDVLFNAALWTVYAAALWYVQARRERRNESRLAAQDGILVYVRYPDARPGSLSGIWNMGVATLDGRAVLKFQPAVYDSLEPSGRPTAFRALAARTTDPRKIEHGERKYITHQGLQAIRIGTDKGDIEVAARPESLPKILDVIRQKEEST